MAKNKKPTMMQVRNVINNLIGQVVDLENRARETDMLFRYYVDFQKDSKDFKKYLEKKAKEFNKEKDKEKKEGKDGKKEK